MSYSPVSIGPRSGDPVGGVGTRDDRWRPTGGSGGGGSSGGPSGGDIGALFPWLPETLRPMLVDLWAQHGDMSVALAHLRQTPEHTAAFPGIRRADGSLRYDEQTYFAQKEGYRAAIREFGFDPAEFDLIGLFEQEIDAQRFARSLFDVAEMFTAPGARRHDGLLQMFATELTKSGSATLALDKVRDSDPYQQVFRGIRREDGSLVMAERDYFAHRQMFRQELSKWGFNPEPFMDHHAELVQGEVSADEFRQKLELKVTGVLQNLPQVREQFGAFYGIDAMDERALVAASLDSDVGLGLLQGRISAAQVAAEASAAGFVRSRTAAERLTGAGGLDQAGARQLYSQASLAVPRTQRYADRFNDAPFGIEEFEEASVFGASEERRRLTRLRASEDALFSGGGTVRRDEGGLSGLTRR